MADVKPFRAVRYAHSTSSVVAPPYDVVSASARGHLLALHPHNVAHLTLADDAREAARLYRAWLEAGVLVRERDPSIWVLEQDVVAPNGDVRRRSGLVASLTAEPYERRVVIPHERTHPEPIASRLELLRSVRAQLEPLFLLYEGEPPLAAPPRTPDIEAGGTRLWRADDAGLATGFFAGRQVLIADGHHRYETALAYAAEHGSPGDARVMAVLVSTADPGLEILAAHRVFTGRSDVVPQGERCGSLDMALARLEKEATSHAAAVGYAGGVATLVRGDAGQLDVELVEAFGVEGISYTVDAREAADRVDSGDADCAFFVRPTRIADVFERSRRGEVMPQKTTHFHPKLTSGLLFHPLDP